MRAWSVFVKFIHSLEKSIDIFQRCDRWNIAAGRDYKIRIFGAALKKGQRFLLYQLRGSLPEDAGGINISNHHAVRGNSL